MSYLVNHIYRSPLNKTFYIPHHKLGNILNRAICKEPFMRGGNDIIKFQKWIIFVRVCHYIKSYRRSGVQFWAGEGYLLKIGAAYEPTILSYKQIMALDKKNVVTMNLKDEFCGMDSIPVLQITAMQAKAY